MRTDKQNQASRVNGARSHGPVTHEGKANSAKNAERHNLCTSPLVLLHNENPEEYRQLMEALILRFLPVDGVELDLVHKLFSASWRERRINGMETALLELEMLRQETAVDDEYTDISPQARHALALFGSDKTKSSAALLLRYAAAARSSYAAALKALREIQGDRFNRRSHAAIPEPGPLVYPSGNHEPTVEPPAATNSYPIAPLAALATFILLRRRRPAPSLQQEYELPNEPKKAFAAGQDAWLTQASEAA